MDASRRDHTEQLRLHDGALSRRVGGRVTPTIERQRRRAESRTHAIRLLIEENAAAIEALPVGQVVIDVASRKVVLRLIRSCGVVEVGEREIA